MSEDTGRRPEDENPDEDEVDESEDDTDEDGSGTGDEDEDGSGDSGKNPELAKAIRRRDRALARARELEAQLAAERAKNSKDGKDDNEPDPVAQANSRLVRAEAKAQLAAVGITAKEDVAAVLDVLNLSTVEVDKNGDVDADEIEDRISTLRRVFTPAKDGTRRVPRTDTRDKGGNSKETTDADAARYKRILTGKR